MVLRNYIIRKVFDLDELKIVNQLLNSHDNVWVDGLVTTSSMDETVKTNVQLSTECPSYLNLSRITMDSIDMDAEFIRFTQPTSSTAITVSKYTKGCYYNIHEDSPRNGKYSTTIFLSDPDSYQGGELCLYINEKEEVFKLPAGYAITYDTGILHKVNKVKSGERSAIVFWTSSYTKDKFLVELINDLTVTATELFKILKDNNIEISLQENDFESYNKNPILRLNHTINKIKRNL